MYRLPSLITSTKLGLSLMIALALLGAAYQPAVAQTPDGSFHNPLNTLEGADPWLTYYDGYYYLSTTTGTSQLYMQKSATLSGLKVAKQEIIYTETEPSRCCNMWAPEFYLLDGPDGKHWYYYYTAGTNGTLDNQHTNVLESAGTDPMGPYTYKARIFDPANDTWAIDGSILQLNNKLYFLFSSWVGDYQKLFIAPMSNPWTISGSRVLLTQSEYDWERSGNNVTEGPEALQHDGKTFIIYSTSFCASADYKLGMLTYNGGDVLDTKSWVKNPEPVFQRSDENSVYGPGHNGFFKSPDGTEDWIVYHANQGPSDGCVGKRTTRVQKFTWNADGTPNFGTPVALTMDIPNPSGDTGKDPLPQRAPAPAFRFAAFDAPTKFINHFSGRGKVSPLGEPAEDFEFVIREGLADPKAVSLESKDNSNYFLLNRNGNVWLGQYDGTDSFSAGASWIQQPGLASADGVSFESVSQAGAYLFHQGNLLNVKVPESDADKAAATFIMTEVGK
jgi:GH43 family beta-xylosidase